MSIALHPSDVAIDRWRIRGSTAVQRRLSRELPMASWPQAKGESWVFIRHIHVQAPAHSLIRELTKTTWQQLDKAHRPSNDSNVIAFGSFSELLAYLLADLATGHAAHQWYWQRWNCLFALPPAKALLNVMSEHLFHLTSTCHHLHTIHGLTKVWSGLSDTHAQQLLIDLRWQLGLRIPDSLPDSALSFPHGIGQPTLSNHLVAQWHPVLREISEQSPRYYLILVLMALESAPFTLQHAPTQLLAWFQRQFRHDPTLPLRILPKYDSESALPLDASPTALILDPSDSDIVDHHSSHKSSSQSSKNPQPLLPAQDTTQKEMATPQLHKENHREVAPPEATMYEIFPPPSHPHKTKDQLQETLSRKIDHCNHDFPHPGTSPLLETFHTEQGGIFYLLNFLARTEIQRLLEKHWQHLPNGWGWVYRLAQELQLDEQDPILDFLAIQQGLALPQDLAGIPSLPARNEILGFAKQWYAKTQVWNHELLCLRARIQYQISHIDLYTSLNNVRLPVRLAGLDINPGWIPWLGKVVTFHFDESQEYLT